MPHLESWLHPSVLVYTVNGNGAVKSCDFVHHAQHFSLGFNHFINI